MSPLALALLIVPALAGGGRGGPERATMPLYRPWDGASKVFVEARLPDGSHGLFLVDTGADVSLLSLATAERLALPTMAEPVTVAGITAVATVEMARLPWVELGGVRVPELEVAIGVPGQLDAIGFMPVVGILGNNVWARFAVELDLHADVLTLGPSGSLPLPRTAAPLHYDGGHAHAPVQFTTAADPDRHHVVMLMLDTGANGVIFRGPTGAALEGDYSEGVEPVLGLVDPSGRPAASWLRPTRRIALDSVVIGGSRRRVDLDARWMDYDARLGGPGLTILGIAGYDLFADRRLLLDYQQGRFAVVPSHRRHAFHDGHTLLLERDVARYGDDPARWLFRAELQLGMEDRASAQATLRRIVDTDHPAALSAAPVAHILLARIARAQGDPDEAATQLAQVPVERLVDQEELVAAVNALLLDGQLGAAEQLVDAAEASRPGAAQTLVAQADVALDRGAFDQARALLARAGAALGDPDGLVLRRARVALMAGDRDAALSLLRGGVQLDPLDGKLLWFYGQVAGVDDLPTLRADLDRAMASTHPRTRPLDFLVGTLTRLGDGVQAQAMMEDGIARDCVALTPAARADNCRAWYWSLAGVRLDEALTRVDAALSSLGERADFLDTKAMILVARGELDAARDAAVAAARLSPSDPYMLWQAARLTGPHTLDQPPSPAPDRPVPQTTAARP